MTYTSNAPGNVPTGTRGTPNLLVDSTTNLKVTSHEFRINADLSDTTSLTIGVFVSDTELIELNLFNYPSSVENDITCLANYPLTNTSATGSINSKVLVGILQVHFLNLLSSLMTLGVLMNKEEYLES